MIDIGTQVDLSFLFRFHLILFPNDNNISYDITHIFHYLVCIGLSLWYSNDIYYSNYQPVHKKLQKMPKVTFSIVLWSFFFCNLMNAFKGCLCVYHLSSYFSLLYITDVFAARTCVTCSFSLIRVTWQLILPLSGIDGASQEEENYPNFCLWVVYDRRLQMSLSGYIPSITVSVHSLEVTVAALNMPTAAFSRFGFKSYLVYMPLNPFLQYSWCA